MPQSTLPPTAPVPKPPHPPQLPVQPHTFHPSHSRLTEHLEHFHNQSKVWARIVLIATGLTAFLIWAMMELRWIDTPLHIVTPVVWIGSLYLINKIKGTY